MVVAPPLLTISYPEHKGVPVIIVNHISMPFSVLTIFILQQDTRSSVTIIWSMKPYHGHEDNQCEGKEMQNFPLQKFDTYMTSIC